MVKNLLIIFICFGLFLECKSLEILNFPRNAWYGVKTITLLEDAFIVQYKNADVEKIFEYEQTDGVLYTNDPAQLLKDNGEKLSLHNDILIYKENEFTKAEESKGLVTQCPYSKYSPQEVHQVSSLNIKKSNGIAVDFKVKQTIECNGKKITIGILKTPYTFIAKKPYCWERLITGTFLLTAGVFFLNRFLKFRKNTVEI